jgi:CheY-like chemotaxis protein
LPHALIVDNDISNLMILGEMLEMEGVSYSQVQDPLRIDEVLSTIDAVDVVFLDLEMPNRDGYQIFEYLRGLEKFASIPIVAYTVHVNEIGVVHELGFDSFLAKPLNSDQFPAQLADILSGKEIWNIK